MSLTFQWLWDCWARKRFFLERKLDQLNRWISQRCFFAGAIRANRLFPRLVIPIEFELSIAELLYLAIVALKGRDANESARIIVSAQIAKLPINLERLIDRSPKVSSEKCAVNLSISAFASRNNRFPLSLINEFAFCGETGLARHRNVRWTSFRRDCWKVIVFKFSSILLNKIVISLDKWPYIVIRGIYLSCRIRFCHLEAEIFNRVGSNWKFTGEAIYFTADIKVHSAVGPSSYRSGTPS